MEKSYSLFNKTAAVFSLIAVLLFTNSKAQVVQTFSYTGSLQTFVVPPCVNSLTIEARGAQGGSLTTGNFPGGKGAIMKGVFNVTSGNVLNVIVGGRGNPEPTTSGGGGASGVGILSAPLIVAGGGGGVDSQDPAYAGMDAVIATTGNPGNNFGGAGGVNGADGGDLVYTSTNISRGGRGWNFNNSGSFGQNGLSATFFTNGTWGIGGGGGSVGFAVCNCGGGGGGYSGGGAGQINTSGGGGGSYNSGTGQTNTAGINTGSGLVIISYSVNGSAVVATNTTMCSGQTVTVNASNVLSYTWTPGNVISSSISVSPSSTTDYTVQGTNAQGCISNAVVTVSVNSTSPTVIISPSSASICSGKTLTLTAIPSGPVTYTWTGSTSSGNTATYTPALPGADYTVTVGNGCGIATASVSIVTNTLPLITAVINTPTVCSGSNVTLTGGGGVAYTWSGGVTDNTPFPPSATTNYTVIGSSAQGCTATAVTGVTVYVIPTVPPVATPTAICVGQTATLSAVGATSYSWVPGVSLVTQSISVSPSGPTTYTLYRDNNGCSSVATITLVVNPLPIISASGSPTQICAGDGSNLIVVGPITNTWFPGGFTQSNFTVFPNATKDYTVVGSNANCTISAVVTVSVNQSPSILVSYATATMCSGSTNNITASGSATSYTWLASGATNIGNGTSVSVSPPSTAQYTLIGANASGCSATVNPLVVVYPLPNTNITSNVPFICSGNVAVIGVTAQPGVSYSWSQGPVTSTIAVSPTVTTNYNLTATTNSTSCQSSSVFPLSVFLATFAVNSPSAICKGSTATLSAVGAATNYTWNTIPAQNASLIAVSPIATTNYSVTGATGNCSFGQLITLVVNPIPAVTAVPEKNPICYLDPSTIIAGGADTYSWNTGETTATISVASQPSTISYTVTGTDLNNCSKTVTVTQYVATCLGIENYGSNNIELDVYPNPNNGNFFISSGVSINLSVVNTMGQQVGSFKADMNKKEIQLNNLPGGIYFITGQANGIKVNKKIIVEK